MADLYVLNGPERGRSLKLREGITFVGRSLDNDIQIEDKTVSRKHLKIVRRGDRYFITDLKSRNGTFYDGVYIDPGLEVGVQEGIAIALGMSVICLGENCKKQIISFMDTVQLTREDLEKSGIFAERRTQSNERNMELLHKVSDVLMRGLPMNEALEKILDYIFDVLRRVDRGAIILVDHGTKQIAESVSRSSMTVGGKSKTYSQRVVARVLKDKSPLVISNVKTEEDDFVDTLKVLKIESVMCTPMIFGSEIAGVIYLDSLKRPYGFRGEDVSVFMELGQQIALAIEKTRFAIEMSRVADTLTSEV